MSETPQDPFVANPYAPTSETAGQLPAPTEVEAYRRTYLKHEASCRSVGTLYLLGSIILTPLGLLAMIGAVMSGFEDQENLFVLIIGLFYLGLGVAQGFVGVGIRRLQNWARIAGILFSVLGLIGFPIGTLISAYFLYLFLSEKGRIVFSDHYREVVAQTPHIKYTTPLVVWILLLALVALFIFAMFLGVRA